MEKFETLLKIYFDKPYRPEFLVKKVNKEIKNSNYDFALIKESKMILLVIILKPYLFLFFLKIKTIHLIMM